MSCKRAYNESQLKFTILIFCILLQLSLFPVFGANDSKKPNLILIVGDDLGYADLGVHGSKQIPTPNIDSIAKEGIIFTQAYVSSPVCSPSRAGLMTGKNQLRFGFDNNLFPAPKGFDPDYVGLPLTEKTLADKLKPLGYVNGLIGKWHLGEKPHFFPTKRGFDEFWGFLGGAHDYFNATPGETGMKCPIECNYKTPADLTYITDDIGNECVDFIKRHKKEPFFLFASFNAPHSPMQATEKDLKKFRHIEDKLRRTYCAMVYRLDQNVGKILKALKDEGLERNSFVVFISDNGGPTSFNGSVNAPLNGQKTTCLEGGIRVPFIFKWPARFDAGKKIDSFVLSLDICPTFIKSAGGTISEKDKYKGVNTIPFLTGQTDKTPHPNVSMKWRYNVSAAIRDGDWKLIRLPDRLPMLFNLSDDISEQNDLALQNLEKTRAMLKKLGTWDISLQHPVFVEPYWWRIGHLGLYDVEYQLVQPE